MYCSSARPAAAPRINMKLLVIVAVLVIQVCGETALITRASNAFANKLYQQVSKTPGNILICPVSLHVALSLLLQGAGGNTATELAKGLGLSSGTNEEVKQSYQAVLRGIQDNTLKIATKLYPAYDLNLNQNYKKDAEEYFLSDVEKLNFTNSVDSANKINKFVEEKTSGKIHDLISSDSLSDLTRLVIINAVHFQASWKNMFHTSYDGVFKVNKLQRVDTKMMSQTDTFDYKEDYKLDAKILKMDYDVEGYSMLFVLPNKDDGLLEVEAKLKDKSVSSLLEGLNPTRVEVTIPKFTLEQTFELNDILKQMGIKDIFFPKANLQKIASGENLFVSKIVQKTFINVHENGTEAAAATVLLETLSAANENIVFFAGKPFHFYLIHNKTPRVILFKGRLVQPVEQGGNKFMGNVGNTGNLEALSFNEADEENNHQGPPQPNQRPTNGSPNQGIRPMTGNEPTSYNHNKNPNFIANKPGNIVYNQGSKLNPYPQVSSSPTINPNSEREQGNFNSNLRPNLNENPNGFSNMGHNPSMNGNSQQPFTQNGNHQESIMQKQNPNIYNSGQNQNKKEEPTSNDKNPASRHPLRTEEEPLPNQHWKNGKQQADRSGFLPFDSSWLSQQHQQQQDDWVAEQNRRIYQLRGYYV